MLQFIPGLFKNGLNFDLFFDQLFINRISVFFRLDVIMSLATIFATVIVNPDRLSRGQRVMIFLASYLGASACLPLYLLVREWNREISE